MTLPSLLILLPVAVVAFVALLAWCMCRLAGQADQHRERMFGGEDEAVWYEIKVDADEVTRAIESITKELEQLPYPPEPPRTYTLSPGWFAVARSQLWRERRAEAVAVKGRG